MRSRPCHSGRVKRFLNGARFFLVPVLLTAGCCIWPAAAGAEIIDRVVASVDDRAITLSEFREAFERTRQVQPDIRMDEVLQTMVNRVLILNEARRLRIEAKTEEEVFREYIDLKVKTLIRLREEEVEEFYRKNLEEFRETPYERVRDRIEAYLTEREINRLLKMHLAELRARAQVRIRIE